jgi:hypothetical protein
MADDRPTELLAVPGVCSRVVKRGLGEPDRTGGDAPDRHA